MRKLPQHKIVSVKVLVLQTLPHAALTTHMIAPSPRAALCPTVPGGLPVLNELQEAAASSDAANVSVTLKSPLIYAPPAMIVLIILLEFPNWQQRGIISRLRW